MSTGADGTCWLNYCGCTGTGVLQVPEPYMSCAVKNGGMNT